MTQGVSRFLNDLTADSALVLAGAVSQAGGGHFGALDLHVVVLVFGGGKVGRQHHTARVGVAGHRKAEGLAAVAGPGAGSPSRKYKAVVRHSRHSRSRRTFFDQLAGRAGNFATVGGHKFQRYLGAAHGDGVLGNQVYRRANRGGNVPQRLRAAVLRHISVGAYIGEIFGHSRLGKMHTVRKGIICLGPAGGIVPQYLGTVQELVTVFLAHLDQRCVVGIHLGHGQVGVFPLLVQRRDGADDDVAVGPGRLNGLQYI